MLRKITFTLPAEAMGEATEALLLGDFNNWNPDSGIALVKQDDGSYAAVAQLETGGTYQYRFLLNDGRWVNDYQAAGYVPVAGFDIDNCVITVSEIQGEEETPVPESEPGKGKVVKRKAAKPDTVKAKPSKEKTGKDKTTKAATGKAAKEKTATAKAPSKKSAGKAEKNK